MRPPEGQAGSLFDEDFHRQTARVEVVARRLLSGERLGDGEIPKRSLAGTLFHDHRGYLPGDDPRHIDWNVYGRLGELMVKRFEAEGRFRAHVLVDRTPSMDVLGLSEKGPLARRLAGGICRIGVAVFEGVRLLEAPGDLAANRRLHRDPSMMPRIYERLERESRGQRATLSEAVRLQRSSFAVRDAVVILSDLHDLEDLEATLTSLARLQKLCVIQIVDPSEARLPESGSLRLRDVETRRVRRVRVTKNLLGAYRRAQDKRQARAAAICRSYRARYRTVSTADSYERSLLGLLLDLR